MVEEESKQEFSESLDNVLKQFEEFCDEDEIAELRESINNCLEDGISHKSLLFMLYNVSKTEAFIKAKKIGIPVSEIFNNVAVYAGNYEEENSNVPTATIQSIAEEYDGIVKEFNDELYNEEESDTPIIRRK